MLNGQILRVEVPASKGFCRRLRVFQIPLHDGIAAHDDFTLGRAVHWDLDHLIVHDGDVLHHRHRNTLAGFDRRLGRLIQVIPVLSTPHAFCYVAIAFGQAVHLGHVEPKRLDLAQSGRRWWGTSGEHFDVMIECAALVVR